jgi:RNA polymerase sigma-70 factor (ECF subfamily)
MEPLAMTGRAAVRLDRRDIVRRAARGDLAAFELLVADSTDRAVGLARAILGNEADARDAAQDAYVSAWRELPRLRDPDRFDAWLRRIVLNACRERLRLRRRVREISLDLDPVERRQAGPAMSDVIADSDLLARAFDRLDAAKRSILVLHYLEHEPVASIAAAMNIPVGTVKWRLSEARAALARALTAEGEARR